MNRVLLPLNPLRSARSANVYLALGDIVLMAAAFIAISCNGFAAAPLFLGCFCFRAVCIMNMTGAFRQSKALSTGLVPLALADVIFPMVFILACTDEDARHEIHDWGTGVWRPVCSRQVIIRLSRATANDGMKGLDHVRRCSRNLFHELLNFRSPNRFNGRAEPSCFALEASVLHRLIKSLA